MKTEGEIRVTPPQAKEHLEPPETGRDGGGFALEASGKCGSASTLILDRWPPDLREHTLLWCEATQIVVFG